MPPKPPAELFAVSLRSHCAAVVPQRLIATSYWFYGVIIASFALLIEAFDVCSKMMARSAVRAEMFTRILHRQQRAARFFLPAAGLRPAGRSPRR